MEKETRDPLESARSFYEDVIVPRKLTYQDEAEWQADDAADRRRQDDAYNNNEDDPPVMDPQAVRAAVTVMLCIALFAVFVSVIYFRSVNMKRQDTFPHLVKTFEMPDEQPALDSIQYYYDRMLECINDNSTPEQILHYMSRVEGFEQAAKQLRNDMKQAVIEWIQEHGDIVLDEETRYYVGPARTTKCISLESVGMALIDACGGDLSRVFEFIKSEGWKHGAVRKMIGQNKFDELYYTEEKLELKTGKPRPLLKKTCPLPKPRTRKELK